MRRPSSRRIVLTATACLLVSCLEGPTSPLAESSDNRAFASPSRSATAISFEALAIGDSAALHFQSDGCFHHFVGDVLLTRTTSGLAVRVLGMTTNLMPGWRIEADTALSLEEVRALDRTLGYLRSGPGGGCTTVERITIEGFDGARAESYVDASCTTPEGPKLLAIGSLFRVGRDSARTGDS
jgi:hypothetical protein